MSKLRAADLASLAQKFKALAHPERLRMLVKVLGCCTEGPGRRTFCCVGDVAHEVNLAPSTVSHHLKELRQAGLVEVTRRGQTIECRRGEDSLRQLAAFFEACCPSQPAGPEPTRRSSRRAVKR